MSRLSRDMRSWRAVYGFNQQRAADCMSVSLKTWQRWEREETKPSISLYRELRELLAQSPPGWIRIRPGEELARG